MARTLKRIWPQVLEWSNLCRAEHEAYKAVKPQHRSNAEVASFKANMEDNLLSIRDQLENHTWRPGQLRTRLIYEPKERVIHIPTYFDRNVHHAVMDLITPWWNKRFIEDSFACRVGKGTHAASARLTEHLRDMQRKTGTKLGWYIKADIKGYFAHINHEVLFSQIQKSVSDRSVLWFCYEQIFDAGFECMGLPIGTLPSQQFANVYLDPFDHWVKERLGIKWYVRYMDDFIILHPDKHELSVLFSRIREYLADILKLELNRKSRLDKIDHRMIDFAGYRHAATYTRPRHRVLRRNARSFRTMSKQYAMWEIDLEYIKPRVASFLGYISRCDGHDSCSSVLRNLCLRRSINDAVLI